MLIAELVGEKILKWAKSVLGVEVKEGDLELVRKHLQLMMDPTFKKKILHTSDQKILEMRKGLTWMDLEFLKIFDKYTHKGMAVLMGNRWVALLFLYFHDQAA